MKKKIETRILTSKTLDRLFIISLLAVFILFIHSILSVSAGCMQYANIDCDYFNRSDSHSMGSSEGATNAYVAFPANSGGWIVSNTAELLNTSSPEGNLIAFTSKPNGTIFFKMNTTVGSTSPAIGSFWGGQGAMCWFRVNSTGGASYGVTYAPGQAENLMLTNSIYLTSGKYYWFGIYTDTETDKCNFYIYNATGESVWNITEVGTWATGAFDNFYFQNARTAFIGMSSNIDEWHVCTGLNLSCHSPFDSPAPPPAEVNSSIYINATSIYSATNRTDSDIQGFCYGTIDDGNSPTNYYYRWYHDRVLNITGNISNNSIIKYTCFQELANETSNCGGLNTGKYANENPSSDFYKLTDKDWNTYTTWTFPSSTQKANFTKPPDTMGAIMRIKYNITENGTVTDEYIEIPQSCWDAEADKIRVYVYLDSQNNNWGCYNSSTQTQNIRNIVSFPAPTAFGYAIIWKYKNLSLNNTSYLISNISATSGNVGNWTFSCLASNGSINSTWVNTSTLDITGFITPDITINPNSFFYANNSLISNATASSALLNVTFTDDYDLYAYEVTIRNSSGTTTYYYSNESLSGAAERTVTKSLQLNNKEGWYSITINVTDSHTANKIENYNVKKTSNSLEFDNQIKITAEGATSSNTVKSEDRYSFEFNYWSKPPKIKTYYLESTTTLTYLPNSKFKGHFIDWANKKWIDFENEENIIITKINDNKYKIEIDTNKTELKFNSIGGLNTNSITYYYYLLNPPTVSFIIPTSFSNYLNLSRPNTQVSINITGNYQNYTRIELYNVSWQLINNITYHHAVNGTSIIYHSFNFSSNSSHKFYINATIVDKAGNKAIPTKDGYNYVKYIEAKEPTISLNITIPSSFGILNATTTIQCMHEWDTYLNYSVAFNDNFLVLRYNQSNGTIISNITASAIVGANTLEGVCWSEYGTAIDSYTTSLYLKTILLWDEKENKPFDCMNISGCKLYFDDNSTLFDFWNVSNSTSFSSLGSNKLRLELRYPSGTIITRYLDVSLFENNITLCANKNGVTHYQQVIYSAISQPVFLKNVYSGCAVAADYTRFGYEDALTLNAYTINMPYYLYVYEDGVQVMLSSLDGSIASDINIDTLIFKAEGFNINEVTKGVGIQKVGADLFYIYYKNLNNNSESVEVSIMDVGQSVTLVDLDTTSFTNPNEWSLYFDTSLYANMTNSTVFKLTITSTDEKGEETILEKVFNYAGSTGVLKSAVGFIIALLITVFGFSFVSTKSTFSFFGILIILISLGILFFSIPAWYITMMAVINVIILIYTIFMLVMMNYTEVIK
jgi:hypothetical protein